MTMRMSMSNSWDIDGQTLMLMTQENIHTHDKIVTTCLKFTKQLCCRGVCQILEGLENSKLESRGFETLRDIA